MSELIEDILGLTKEAEPEIIEPRPMKQKPAPEPRESGLLDGVSKVLEDLLAPINRRLDDIEKRVSQPVQFKTSGRATESSSAEKPEAAKPTGSAGQ